MQAGDKGWASPCVTSVGHTERRVRHRASSPLSSAWSPGCSAGPSGRCGACWRPLCEAGRPVSLSRPAAGGGGLLGGRAPRVLSPSGRCPPWAHGFLCSSKTGALLRARGARNWPGRARLGLCGLEGGVLVSMGRVLGSCSWLHCASARPLPASPSSAGPGAARPQGCSRPRHRRPGPEAPGRHVILTLQLCTGGRFRRGCGAAGLLGRPTGWEMPHP